MAIQIHRLWSSSTVNLEPLKYFSGYAKTSKFFQKNININSVKSLTEINKYHTDNKTFVNVTYTTVCLYTLCQRLGTSNMGGEVLLLPVLIIYLKLVLYHYHPTLKP